MKKLTLLILILPLVYCCRQEPSEISQWRGTNRDGFYPDKNLLNEWPEEGPELLWSYEDLGNGYSTVAITKEKIFTTGMFDSTSYIIALDHDGNFLWKKEYGPTWINNFPGTRSTPLIYGEFGYILSGKGKLVCFNTDNGDLVWSKDLYTDFLAREIRFGMTENLLIHKGKLYCTPGGVRAGIVTLNPKNGDVIWQSRANGERSAYCSPTILEINGKDYFVTHTEFSIIALDPEDGKLIWSHDMQYPHGIHGNTPVYHDGYIFAMNGWGHGSVMLKVSEDGQSVKEVWRSNLFDLEHGDVIRIGNNIYGADYTTKHFSCVDWYTGMTKDSIKDLAPATVIAADDMIYCYDYRGYVALIKPKADGFDIISSFRAAGVKRDHIAHPVIDDGKLYIRYDNALWVYSISDPNI